MTDDKATDAPRPLLRRRALIAMAAGAGLWWWGWQRIAQAFVGDFDFEPVDDPAGFRRIANGETSGLSNPFIGLDATRAPSGTMPMPAVRADLCGILFGGKPPPGVVPIAFFSDYNCPFCRVLTGTLADLEDRAGGSIRIAWHEWPRLGPTSVSAARAALAADMQGAYAAFHKTLMRGRFVPTERFLRELAREIGLNGDRLLSDMESAAVSTRLRQTDALARLFGFPGTPALVVGRTIVVGNVSEAVISALVDREREDGALPVCGR